MLDKWLVRVSWTARKSNRSILKEISPEYSLEELMLKLKYQYLGQYLWEELTHRKRPWCWQRLRAGGEGGDRGWDGWMVSLTRWTWVWASFGSWWRIEACHAVVHGVAKSQTWLSDWTELDSICKTIPLRNWSQVHDSKMANQIENVVRLCLPSDSLSSHFFYNSFHPCNFAYHS